jgi:hypothetical protein
VRGIGEEFVHVRQVPGLAAEALQLFQAQRIDSEQDHVRLLRRVYAGEDVEAIDQRRGACKRNHRRGRHGPPSATARVHPPVDMYARGQQHHRCGDRDGSVNPLAHVQRTQPRHHRIMIVRAEKRAGIPERVEGKRCAGEQAEPADDDADEFPSQAGPECESCTRAEPRKRTHCHVQQHLARDEIGHLSRDPGRPDVVGDRRHDVGRFDAADQGNNRRVRSACQEQDGEQAGNQEAAAERQVR